MATESRYRRSIVRSMPSRRSADGVRASASSADSVTDWWDDACDDWDDG